MPALLCILLGLGLPDAGIPEAPPRHGLPGSIADDELEGPAAPVFVAEEFRHGDVFSWTQQPPPKGEKAPAAAGQPAGHEGAHSSWGTFFSTHGSCQAWEENVWRDYLTAPPILIPVGLAVGAGITKLWDKRIQKGLKDSMGNREWIGDAAMSLLLASSLATAFLRIGERKGVEKRRGEGGRVVREGGGGPGLWNGGPRKQPAPGGAGVCAPGMFDSLGVKVPSQPDGGEG